MSVELTLNARHVIMLKEAGLHNNYFFSQECRSLLIFGLIEKLNLKKSLEI